jgi:hypothetical protein
VSEFLAECSDCTGGPSINGNTASMES